MSNTAISRRLLLILKEGLRERDLTYRELARSLRISEPTLKRFFAGRGVTLDRVLKVCETLGISLMELATRSQPENDKNVQLSVDQELAFARQPGLFGFFRDLYAGLSPARVRKAWDLSGPQYFRALRRLERLGLLDIVEKERFVFRVRGVLRWSHSGPLTARLVPEQNAEFLRKVYRNLTDPDLSFLTTETLMTKTTFRELHRELQSLGQKYRALALRETRSAPREELTSVRWMAAAAPFESDWRSYPLEI